MRVIDGIMKSLKVRCNAFPTKQKEKKIYIYIIEKQKALNKRDYPHLVPSTKQRMYPKINNQKKKEKKKKRKADALRKST